MHNYSIDNNDREKIRWFIIILSLGFGYFTNKYLQHVITYQQISWIIDAPASGLAYFGIFHKLFDSYLWKWLPKWWINTPRIGGIYKGSLFSSRDNKKSPTKITLTVNQTLYNIQIFLSTEQSESKSEMAAIVLGETSKPILIYEFINDHRVISDPKLSIHRGTTRLTYDDKHKSFQGTYYTSPERKYFGQISVKKIYNLK